MAAPENREPLASRASFFGDMSMPDMSAAATDVLSDGDRGRFVDRVASEAEGSISGSMTAERAEGSGEKAGVGGPGSAVCEASVAMGPFSGEDMGITGQRWW